MSDTTLPNDKTEAMEALQPKPMPQTPVPPTPAAHQAPMGGGIPPQAQVIVERENEEQQAREGATIQFAIGKLNDYLQWFLMVLEAMLGLRFVLKMLAADPGSFFANFIFSITEVLLIPFQGTAPTISLHVNQAFEFSTLFAAAIYFLLVYALRRFLRIAAE
ncbi:MAG: YggT family protein [Ktedonobacteraceae bacterium]